MDQGHQQNTKLDLSTFDSILPLPDDRGNGELSGIHLKSKGQEKYDKDDNNPNYEAHELNLFLSSSELSDDSNDDTKNTGEPMTHQKRKLKHKEGPKRDIQVFKTNDDKLSTENQTNVTCDNTQPVQKSNDFRKRNIHTSNNDMICQS